MVYENHHKSARNNARPFCLSYNDLPGVPYKKARSLCINGHNSVKNDARKILKTPLEPCCQRSNVSSIIFDRVMAIFNCPADPFTWNTRYMSDLVS
jgi:hypothetical protein